MKLRESYIERNEVYEDENIIVSYQREDQMEGFSHENVGILHSVHEDVVVRVDYRNEKQTNRSCSEGFEEVVKKERDRLAKLPAHVRRVIGLGLEDKIEGEEG